MDALQAEASRNIVQATGSEAGCVTASVASGICISLAAAMTGADLGLAEDLPDISKVSKNEVIILKGHVVNYGSVITQQIRLVEPLRLKLAQSRLLNHINSVMQSPKKHVPRFGWSVTTRYNPD